MGPRAWSLVIAATEPPQQSPVMRPLDEVVSAVQEAFNGFLRSLPGFVTAAVLLTIAWLIGRRLRDRLEPQLAELRTPSFGRVFSTLAYVGVLLLGLMVALPAAIPSLTLGALLGGLGLMGIAGGFAFGDILSNLLAGLLLILRQPFIAGDEIEVDDYRGTVKTITIRETMLQTFDGPMVAIPNADVYSNAITVQTAVETMRNSIETRVAYGTDLARARQIALDAVTGLPGVCDEPAPRGRYIEHGGYGMILQVRYWTTARQEVIDDTLDHVAAAIHDAFLGHNIRIPLETEEIEYDEIISIAEEEGPLPVTSDDRIS